MGWWVGPKREELGNRSAGEKVNGLSNVGKIELDWVLNIRSNYNGCDIIYIRIAEGMNGFTSTCTSNGGHQRPKRGERK